MSRNTLRHTSLRPSHPGELLAADLDALKVSKTEVAASLGVTRKALYDVLDGKSGVTAVMAVRLEAVLGSSAEMWFGLQAAHDIWKARQKVEAKNLKKLVA